MENFEWLAPLKIGVLLIFFITFTLITTVTMSCRLDSRLGALPLEDAHEC
jgi:hypothetical protein